MVIFITPLNQDKEVQAIVVLACAKSDANVVEMKFDFV
jgi:hypothetical protein